MEISQLLAYETGVHLGDGNLTYNKWNLNRITYAGNAVEDYDFFVDLLPKIIERLYNRSPRIYFPKNEKTVLVVLNSKKVAQFKMQLGLPSGNKNQIKLFPKELVEEFPEFLLRGLADTDFTVNFRDLNNDGIKEHPRMCASFSNKNFVEEISKILNKLEITFAKREIFTHGKYQEYRIELEGKNRLKRWIELIGFSNIKHINKINNYFGPVAQRLDFW